jgi:hypothetical protein
MAKRKDPSQWSEAYRKRIESYERRNPGASRAEAAGKAKKPAPEPSKPTRAKPPKPSNAPRDAGPKIPKAPKRTKEPSGNRRTKDPSEWTPAYRKRIESFFRRNPDGTLTEARRGAQSRDIENMSELEVTIWSQKIKLSNIDLREAVGNLSSDEARQARSILKQMIRETTLMFEVYPVGTTGYYDQQDKLKALYKRLKALGLVDQSGDINHRGDVGYH